MRVVCYGILGILIVFTVQYIFLGCGSMSSSPASTVRDFYTALDKGNVFEAKQCLAVNFRPYGFYPIGAPPYEEIDAAELERKRKECLKFLAGNIQEVEVTGERMVEEEDSTTAVVAIRLALKPGFMEQFRNKEREVVEELRRTDIRNTSRYKELLMRRSAIWFITTLTETQYFLLEKWNKEWKIVAWQNHA